MKIGRTDKQMLKTGLGVIAAMLMSTATFAQDVTDEVVLYPYDPVIEDGDVQNWHDVNPGGGDDQGIAVGEPDPNDGGPDIVIDDGDYIPGDDGETGDHGDDTGDAGDDTGDENADDGDVDVTIYQMDGGPVLCSACEVGIDVLSPEIYQSAAAPVVQHHKPAAVAAAKPRRSAGAPLAVSNAAECLALHPQLPWLCEWQNGAGQ
jgi:hypothetical protein